MPNGSSDGSQWQAINELRSRAEDNSGRVAVIESQIQTMTNTVVATERRLEAHLDDLEKSINARLDRTRNTALALLAVAVPVISALVGALIRGGGS